MCWEDSQLCTLLSQLILAHLCWPLLSLFVWKSDWRLGSPVEAAQPTKTSSSPYCCHLTCPIAASADKSSAPSAQKGPLLQFFHSLWICESFLCRQGELKASYQLRLNWILPRPRLGKAVPTMGRGNKPKGGLRRVRPAAAFPTGEGRTRQQLWQWAPTHTRSLPQESGSSDNPLPHQRLELIPPTAPVRKLIMHPLAIKDLTHTGIYDGSSVRCDAL